jgi:hypothetical protein
VLQDDKTKKIKRDEIIVWSQNLIIYDRIRETRLQFAFLKLE